MSNAVDAFVENAEGVVSATSHHEGAHIHVYHGELADHDGTVRLRTLAPDIEDTTASDAFMQTAGEWQNASTHPNIVTVYERGETPRPWVAVEDVDGQPLDTAQSNLEPTERASVVADAAEAVRNAALYNSVHGALSPEHIFVVPEDDGVTAVVDDWGLRQAVQTAVDELDVTPYTAPELLEDSAASNERTDVYGLGGVAYYVLTGNQPISGADLAAAIREGDVTPPSEFDETLSEAVDDALLQALAIEPDDRHESAYAFKRAFAAAYSPEPAEDDDDTAAAGAAAVGGADEDEAATDDSDDDSSALTTRRTALGALGVGVVGLGGGLLATQMGDEENTDGTDGTSPAETTESTEAPTADRTAPSISAFSISNTSGRELRISFESNEELASIQANISGPESALLTEDNFSESVSSGAYTYEVTYQADSDGTYEATLDEAVDGSGDEWQRNARASVTVETNDNLIYDFESSNPEQDWITELGGGDNYETTTQDGYVISGERAGNLRATNQNQERRLELESFAPSSVRFYIALENISGDLNGYHWSLRSGQEKVMTVRVSGFYSSGNDLGINDVSMLDSTPTNELLHIEFTNIDFENNECTYTVTRVSDDTVLTDGTNHPFNNPAASIDNFWVRNDDTDESAATSHITEYIRYTI